MRISKTKQVMMIAAVGVFSICNANAATYVDPNMTMAGGWVDTIGNAGLTFAELQPALHAAVNNLQNVVQNNAVDLGLAQENLATLNTEVDQLNQALWGTNGLLPNMTNPNGIIGDMQDQIDSALQFGQTGAYLQDLWVDSLGAGAIGTTGDIFSGGNIGTSGRVDADGDIFSGGNIGTSGRVDADGDIFSGGNIGTSGNIGADGHITAQSGATINGGGGLYVEKNIYAAGNIGTAGDFYAGGDATIDGGLVVNDSATINNGLAVNGGLVIDGDDLITDIIGNRTYANEYNVASDETITESINKLDNVIGDMASLDSNTKGDFSGVNNVVDGLIALDNLIHRNDADGKVHLGDASFTFDDSNPVHVIGTTTKGGEIEMDDVINIKSGTGGVPANLSNDNVFVLGSGAYVGLTVNGDNVATQDWVQNGFAQVYNDMNAGIQGLNNRIDRLDSELNVMGAQSAAMASLVPNARSAGNTQISMGIGAYGDAQAAAVGAFHYLNNGTLVNFKASYGYNSNYDTAGKFQVGAGITFGF